MSVTGRSQRWLLCVCSIWAACLIPGPAQGRSPTSEELRRQAEQAEERGDWRLACRYYEQLPARERNQADTHKRYRACCRHAERIRRHRDPGYALHVQQLSLTHALALYEEILHKLHLGYVDLDRADVTRLFRLGLEELGHALNDPEFSRQHVTAGPDAIREFQTMLTMDWAERKFRKPSEAAADAGHLAQSAEEMLGTPSVVIVLELVCGACALDPYTAYLTPGQFSESNTLLKGARSTIGIAVVAGDQKLVISQVLSGSSAMMAGLKTGDFVLVLAGQPAQGLSLEKANELLAGDPGTSVELTVQSRDTLEARLLILPRQPVHVPSITATRLVGDTASIGYIQLTAFHELTPRELDEALRELQMSGARALILDLRGNPGGDFAAALQVVNRFLAGGVIVLTKSPTRALNRKHEAQNPQPLEMPLVLLVDGGTASVAEMVAGALKEHDRATLVGQPTFGKGLLQKVRPLTNTSSGIQMTVARFLSPLGRSYDGVGVEPQIRVKRTPPETAMDMAEDLQLKSAIEAARK